MIRRLSSLVVVLALAVVPAQAGKFNSKISIGDPAPTFSNLPGADGKSYSLVDMKDKDVVVVVVTCNHCPVAVAYEDRIIAFTKKYAGKDSKVGIIAINVNTNDQDKLVAMTQRAKEKGFNFPYAYDESQQIGKALGASVTPEFFVFNKERKLVYMGAMDDSQKSPKVNYLEAAVEATLAGKSVETAETRARGCGVQYKK